MIVLFSRSDYNVHIPIDLHRQSVSVNLHWSKTQRHSRDRIAHPIINKGQNIPPSKHMAYYLGDRCLSFHILLTLTRLLLLLTSITSDVDCIVIRDLLRIYVKRFIGRIRIERGDQLQWTYWCNANISI